MISIAIVEDEKTVAENMNSLLNEYADRSGIHLEIKHYTNAVNFLTNYKTVYDIVFMDIELPDLNGMEAAYKLREKDKDIIIIFATNMAQFAVKGYKVGALDFIVKPLIYGHLEQAMNRAESIITSRRNEPELIVPGTGGFEKLKASEIKYIEISNHTIIYHVIGRTVTTASGSLRKLEEELLPVGFMRCNNCYLVNFKYVTALNGFTVTVGKDDLQISHSKRKAFLTALTEYFGRGD